MKKIGIIAVILLLTGCASTKQLNNDKKELTAVLLQSAKDWSAGDIEAYMNAYWKSDQLQFIGSNGITYGWDTTLANYKKSYPTKADTGTLHFEILEITYLSKNLYSVVGKYKVAREKGLLTGVFSILFKKIEGKWLIISDHSE